MPKTSNYGASYPDGTIIAHDNTVVNGPDEGTEDVPKLQESRPIDESDGKKTADERGEDNAATTRTPTEDERSSADRDGDTSKAAPRARKTAAPAKSNGTDEK